MENLLDLMFVDIDGLPYPNLEIKNDATIYQIILRDAGQLDKNGKLQRKRARMELAYVYFMCKRDLYSGYLRHEKHDRIRVKVGLPETWEPDALINRCMNELSDDIKTKQDKLLESMEELAEDFLDLFSELKKNNKRLINFFQQSITNQNVTAEEQETRTQEIKAAKDEIIKFTNIVESVDSIIKKIDEYKASRIRTDASEKRKKLSSLETDKDRYERKSD